MRFPWVNRRRLKHLPTYYNNLNSNNPLPMPMLSFVTTIV